MRNLPNPLRGARRRGGGRSACKEQHEQTEKGTRYNQKRKGPKESATNPTPIGGRGGGGGGRRGCKCQNQQEKAKKNEGRNKPRNEPEKKERQKEQQQ